MHSRSLRRNETLAGGRSTGVKGRTLATPAIVLHPPPDASDGRYEVPATSGRQRGNNHYGNIGRKKCQPCRKIKCKCIYNEAYPEETCSRCKKRGFLCGPKVSAKQGRELERGHNDGGQSPNQQEIWSPAEPYLSKILSHRDPSECPEVMKRKIRKELEDDEHPPQLDEYLMSDDVDNAVTEYENEDEGDERSIFGDDRPADLEYDMPIEMGAKIMGQPWSPWIEPSLWPAPAVNNTQFNVTPFRTNSPFNQDAVDPPPPSFHNPQGGSEHYPTSGAYHTSPGSLSNNQETYPVFGQSENMEVQHRPHHSSNRNGPLPPFNNPHLREMPRLTMPGGQQYGNGTIPGQSQHRQNSPFNQNPNHTTGQHGRPWHSRRQ